MAKNKHKDILDFLLKTLGIKSSQADDVLLEKPLKNTEILGLNHIDDETIFADAIVPDGNNGNNMRLSFGTAEEWLRNLPNVKRFVLQDFIWNVRQIANPYFGSKSLEEMMIRRDLLSNEA